MTFVKFMLLSYVNTQKIFEALVREKIRQPSNLEIEDANGKHGDEASVTNISLVDNAALFYKVVDGSNKERLYGLGSKGMIVVAGQTALFFLS